MDTKMKKEDKFILNKLLFGKLECSLFITSHLQLH